MMTGTSVRKNKCTLNNLTVYAAHLQAEERSRNTIEKYLRDLRAFRAYLGASPLSKTAVLNWKATLVERYAPASVNSMLAALNSYLSWAGLGAYKVKPLKIQRAIYLNPQKDLSEAEYRRLIRAAELKQDTRLSLLLQTICATGIRVSELQYITIEAIKMGQTQVACKGKNRTVFIPRALCVALRRFSKKARITTGAIFRTKSGRPMDRSNIWKAMKALCKAAGVAPEKAFPHNLRHLFAKTYYRMAKDISRLADLLGHSSINTTRIYTMESGVEHEKQVNRMGLSCFRN